MWIRNIESLVVPYRYVPDWSGKSIPLVHLATCLSEPRTLGVAAFYLALAAWLWRALLAPRRLGPEVVAVAWVVITFLMTSNLAVIVGFVLADRTLYLPSAGYCMLLAMLFCRLIEQPPAPAPAPIAAAASGDGAGAGAGAGAEADALAKPPAGTSSSAAAAARPRRWNRWVARAAALAYLALLAVYFQKNYFHNRLWAKPVDLWESAYRINPHSGLVLHEFGLSLANNGRNEQAQVIIREAMAVQPSDASKHVMLALVYRNSGRCNDSWAILDEGTEVLSHDPKDGHRPLLSSFLLMERSRCAGDLPTMIKLAVDAVNAGEGKISEPNQHAVQVHNIVQQVMEMGLQPANVGIYWTPSGIQFFTSPSDLTGSGPAGKQPEGLGGGEGMGAIGGGAAAGALGAAAAGAGAGGVDGLGRYGGPQAAPVSPP